MSKETKDSKTTHIEKKSKEKNLETKKNIAKKAKEKKTTTKATPKDSKTKKAVAKTTKQTSKAKTLSSKNSAKTAKTKKEAKSTTRKSKKETKPVVKSEYYDLPYSYNKTVVKILAQTPKMLFVYWEISESDRQNFINTYGKNFFEETKPILVLYNDTLHYSFEVEINDFANSWYIHIDDSNCDYRVELGRKPYNNKPKTSGTQTQEFYIPYYVFITSSNKTSSPNDKILFNKNSTLTFRNIKTGKITEKNINKFKFITNYGVFSIQELYNSLYPNEDFSYEKFLRNPSSGTTSSISFSSQFK